MILIKGQGRNGASDGLRTHDLLHGKQMLYQLSYTRVREGRSIPKREPFGKRNLALKIVHHHAGAVGLEDFFHKLQVARVILIGILRGLVIKHEVQSHLIGLVDHIAMTARHRAAVVVPHAGNVLEIFLRAGQQIGPWTLQRRLGAGEFSAVWSATRANLDDEYALKISAVPPKTKGRRKKNAQAEGSTLLHWEYQLYTGYVGGKRGHAGIPRTPALCPGQGVMIIK